MYISIIADNIADRKHLERLMKRSHDALAEDVKGMYVDSYGNAEAALHAPMKYNLFILDTIEDSTAEMIIHALQKAKVPGPICVCRKDGVACSFETSIPNLWTIDKPISQLALDELVLKAFAHQVAHTVETIEIRGKEKTYYVEPDDILYAQAGEIANYIHLSDGNCILYYGEFDDLHYVVLDDRRFTLFKKDVLVNKNHIVSMDKHTLTLTSGQTLKKGLFAKKLI